MKLINGDCIEELKKLPDDSVDSIVTDPPAGINFMGKSFDSDRGGRDKWIAWLRDIMKECIRVLKPGGHALVWSLPRTGHWTATAVEDAGFAIREKILHLFGSGFPKSTDISKQIDKMNFRFYDDGFRVYLNGQKKKLHLTNNDINKKLGVATTGGGMASMIFGNKIERYNELPTAEMYKKLKPILELDNRYDELIEKTEAERERIGKHKAPAKSIYTQGEKELSGDVDITAPATPEAEKWNGGGQP